MIFITLPDIGLRRFVDSCCSPEEALERLHFAKQQLTEEMKLVDTQIKCIKNGGENCIRRRIHTTIPFRGVNTGL